MKKTFKFALIVVFVLISFMVVSQSAEIVYGDINGDGEFDSADLIYMKRSLANWNGYSMTDSQKKIADVNLNRSFDVEDVIIASRHIANWESCSVLPAVEPGRILTVLEKGVNLEGLEDSDKSSTYMTNSSTFSDIASKGFDHVRLPVDFRYYANSDGTIKSSFYTKLDNIISLANENGLAVCLDFHSWWDFNLANGDDKLFYAIWEDVATHYKDYDVTMLAFELINEPHTTEGGDLNEANLNKIQRKAVEIIREITPLRTIVLAAAEWNSPWMLPSYTLTEYDNVYLAIHTYAPLDFTHQGMAWHGTADVKISLDEYRNPKHGGTIETLKHYLEYIPPFVKRTGMKVILNEFGLNTTGHISDADVKLYLETIANFTEANDIPWTYWSYNGNSFGLYDKGSWNGTGAKWRGVPLNALIPQG